MFVTTCTQRDAIKERFDTGRDLFADNKAPIRDWMYPQLMSSLSYSAIMAKLMDREFNS